MVSFYSKKNNQTKKELDQVIKIHITRSLDKNLYFVTLVMACNITTKNYVKVYDSRRNSNILEEVKEIAASLLPCIKVIPKYAAKH